MYMSQNVNLKVRHHSIPQYKQILPRMRHTNVKALQSNSSTTHLQN